MSLSLRICFFSSTILSADDLIACLPCLCEEVLERVKSSIFPPPIQMILAKNAVGASGEIFYLLARGAVSLHRVFLGKFIVI